MMYLRLVCLNINLGFCDIKHQRSLGFSGVDYFFIASGYGIVNINNELFRSDKVEPIRQFTSSVLETEGLRTEFDKRYSLHDLQSAVQEPI